MRKPYSKYKKLPHFGLSQMPEHWEIKRGKYVFKAIDERSEAGKETLLSVSEHYGVIPRDQANVNMFQAESYEGYKICSKGDLVINSLWAWSRGLGFSEHRGIVSTAYDVFRLRKNEQNFYKYFDFLLRTKRYVGEYLIRSKGIWISRLQLSAGAFLDIPILLPPFDEQQKIAEFLDYKCTLIDTAIRKKTRLIELLKEQKQAIINRVVTRGLNPDAPMKNSGIEWLGEIPAHWVVKKLRYVGQCQNGISEGSEYFGHGYPFVSYIDVYKNWALPTEVSGLANSSIVERNRFSVLEGDVFFTRTSETIEEIGLTATCMSAIENATFAGFLIRFRPRRNMLIKEFSKFYFRSNIVRNFIVQEINLVTRASLSQELLKRLPIFIPPISEQKQIVDFIFQESKTIVTAIARIEREIELIKEYKTALIAEAVTGKIDVRDWKPKSKITNQVENVANL